MKIIRLLPFSAEIRATLFFCVWGQWLFPYAVEGDTLTQNCSTSAWGMMGGVQMKRASCPRGLSLAASIAVLCAGPLWWDEEALWDLEGLIPWLRALEVRTGPEELERASIWKDFTCVADFIMRLFNRPLTNRLVDKILINKLQDYSSNLHLSISYFIPGTPYAP